MNIVKNKLKVTFAICAAILCMNSAAGPAVANQKGMVASPKIIQQLIKKHTEDVPILWENAKETGLLHIVEKASRAPGSLKPEDALTVSYRESECGKNIGAKYSSFQNPWQMSNETVLYLMARYGHEIKEQIASVSPQTARRFDSVARFITYDEATGEIQFDNRGYKKTYGGRIRSAASSLCNGKKKNWPIHFAMFSYNIKKDLPQLKKVVQKKGSSHVKTLISQFGDGFLIDMLNNFGNRGAKKFVTYRKVSDPVSRVVGSKVASARGWKKETVKDVLTKYAIAYSTISEGIAGKIQESQETARQHSNSKATSSGHRNKTNKTKEGPKQG